MRLKDISETNGSGNTLNGGLLIIKFIDFTFTNHCDIYKV